MQNSNAEPILQNSIELRIAELRLQVEQDNLEAARWVSGLLATIMGNAALLKT